MPDLPQIDERKRKDMQWARVKAAVRVCRRQQWQEGYVSEENGKEFFEAARAAIYDNSSSLKTGYIGPVVPHG